MRPGKAGDDDAPVGDSGDGHAAKDHSGGGRKREDVRRAYEDLGAAHEGAAAGTHHHVLVRLRKAVGDLVNKNKSSIAKFSSFYVLHTSISLKQPFVIPCFAHLSQH